MSDHFTPHFYQRNAAARIISEPTVLLDHVVGAGKTGSMVAGALELRRLGLVRQPWLVVPNAITEQVGREAQQWYPAAKILLGSAATTADGRRRFIAQTASSEWDLVVIPQSAFTAINVSKDMRVDYIEEPARHLTCTTGNRRSRPQQKAHRAGHQKRQGAAGKTVGRQHQRRRPAV